jgi:hypothetical protein
MSFADNQDSMLRSIHSSQRVSLLGIINCLTIVSYPESGTATTFPLGDVQLCTQDMIAVIKPSLLDTIEFVVRQCLSGFQVAALSKMGADNIESSGPSARQSLSRSVTVSLPPVIALML